MDFRPIRPRAGTYLCYLSNRTQISMVYKLSDEPRGMLEEHEEKL